MYGDIAAAALPAINLARELATLVLKAKVDSAVREKAIELQSAIIDLQTTLLTLQAQYQTLLKDKERVEKELMQIQQWADEAQKYELTQISPGFFVYAIKPDQRGAEPVHWLCASCYQNKRKSILQKHAAGHGLFSCPTCKTLFGSR